MFNLIPYNRREVNPFRFFDDLERNFFTSTVSGAAQFRCDISEKDGNYLLEAELPGFSKEDIHVELDSDKLTISAAQESKEEEKDKDGNYIRRERRFGSYSRSFDISGIDTDNITANYTNGVLSLTLPKAKELAPQTRKIEIAG